MRVAILFMTLLASANAALCQASDGSGPRYNDATNECCEDRMNYNGFGKIENHAPYDKLENTV
ncbi:MAG: hypothetical protein M1837_006281 [Sclerophora amabilis]|nr:MAG: hypothetical protein M1837_006281 [Sclerophora amabilis]